MCWSAEGGDVLQECAQPMQSWETEWAEWDKISTSCVLDRVDTINTDCTDISDSLFIMLNLVSDVIIKIMDLLPVKDQLMCKTVARGWRQECNACSTNLRLVYEGKQCELCREESYQAKRMAVTRSWRRTLKACRPDVLQNLHISLRSADQPRILAGENLDHKLIFILCLGFTRLSCLASLAITRHAQRLSCSLKSKSQISYALELFHGHVLCKSLPALTT